MNADDSTYSDNYRYGVELNEKERQILEAVEKAPHPITPKEISSITGINASTVRFYLRELERKSIIHCLYHGHYVPANHFSTFNSSVVGKMVPMLHNVRLKFEGVALEPRYWVKDFGEVVKCTFTVCGNETALVFVDCLKDVTLDYPAFRLVLDCISEELPGMDWDSCVVTNFEFNCDFDGVKVDGVKGVTFTAFDGSFRRVYNKRLGVRDEVKVVGSRRVEDVLALLQGGVSTYNIMQLLFANFQRVSEFIEAEKFKNRLFADLISQNRRLIDYLFKNEDQG